MWIAYNTNKIGYAASWVKANLAPVCEDGPSLIANAAISWSDNKQFAANANVLSVTFTLPKAMYVSIVADGSAFIAKGAAPQSFTTGLYSGVTEYDVDWIASQGLLAGRQPAHSGPQRSCHEAGRRHIHLLLEDLA
jgi:hypothetical protein